MLNEDRDCYQIQPAETAVLQILACFGDIGGLDI